MDGPPRGKLVAPLAAGRTVVGIGAVAGTPALDVAWAARPVEASAFAAFAVEVGLIWAELPASVWAGFPGLAGIEVAPVESVTEAVASVESAAEVVALVLFLAGVWLAAAEAWA